MSYDQLLKDLSEMLVQFKGNLMAIIPNLIFALLIIFVGVFIAHFLKALFNSLIKKLDLFFSNRKLPKGLKHIRLEHSSRLMGKLVFWIIIFFFLTIATEVMGLPIITTWFSGLLKYLPNILIAAIIVFLGFSGGRLLRDMITAATGTAGILYGDVLGKIAQYIILLIAILIAAEQVGINISILAGMINIILAAILFGAALAFGLGARDPVSNILASYYLQSRYQEGQRIKIGDIEGRIIQITPTTVVFETINGQVTVPAKKFSEDIATLLKSEGL